MGKQGKHPEFLGSGQRNEIPLNLTRELDISHLAEYRQSHNKIKDQENVNLVISC